MIGILRSSEELLRKRLNSELRSGEEFVTGAAGRTKVRFVPQSLSLTGYYVALTTERVLVFYFDRATSSPGKLYRGLERSDISPDEIWINYQKTFLHIVMRNQGEELFNLVFRGREKRLAVKLAECIQHGS